MSEDVVVCMSGWREYVDRSNELLWSTSGPCGGRAVYGVGISPQAGTTVDVVDVDDEDDLLEERLSLGTGHSQGSPLATQASQVGFCSSHFLCLRRQLRQPVLTRLRCAIVVAVVI